MVSHFIFNFLLFCASDLLSHTYAAVLTSFDQAVSPSNLTTATTALENALSVMQSQFWDSNTSTWPTGIDWTRAVLNTHLSAALSTLARSRADTTMDTYFPQVVAFFDGEGATSLKTQKYDDIQWVILEWLEAIKFITYYSTTETSFVGKQYIPEFAQRASEFWDLAEKGWNDTLCGGGMVWADELAPYKNAITNQLFVASSVGMYLYSPGDEDVNSSEVKGRDQKYLNTAVREYEWLSTSNMTNSQGLYVDGFHITNWTSQTSSGTGKCDARDESIYTYNQGVILSGVRGLWDATGNSTYLSAGHALIQNVINATGWATKTSIAWAGLGSDGILQDLCDVDGSCSQDAQTFKGIFFHHLALFCAPLETDEKEAYGVVYKASITQSEKHMEACGGYNDWILHNAQAAYRTRNQTGIYGMWWDLPSPSIPQQSVEASDHRNLGIPQTPVWLLESMPPVYGPESAVSDDQIQDPNERGRGRTVETQSGGLAVARCLVQTLEESSS